MKKAKLDGEVEPESSVGTPMEDVMEDVVELEAETQDQSEGHPASTSEAKGKGKEKGSAAFKESPYAYLSPDDPILQQCM